MRFRDLACLALGPFVVACSHSGPRETVAAAKLEPLIYTIRIPAPASKTFDVDLIVPTDAHDSVSLMMPVWSPGMYTLQSYGDRVTAISARAADGTPLAVDKRTRSRGS